MNISFLTENLPYSQICGTKVGPSYKKRRQSGNFNLVNLKVNYNAFSKVTDIRSHDFDKMVANSGASFVTQSHVIMMYDQIFKSVAPWSEEKSIIMNSLGALDLMPWVIHDMMAAVSQVDVSGSYGKSVKAAVAAATHFLSETHLKTPFLGRELKKNMPRRH